MQSKEELQERLKTLDIERAEIEALLKKPTPEERFWELCQGLEIKIDMDKYPTSTFFFKGDDFWFEYNAENGYLWCSLGRVWDIFYKEYIMDYNTTQTLIKRLVEEHFKRKGVTPPYAMSTPYQSLVEEHFKRKGVTPNHYLTLQCSMVEEHFKRKGVTPF